MGHQGCVGECWGHGVSAGAVGCVSWGHAHVVGGCARAHTGQFGGKCPRGARTRGTPMRGTGSGPQGADEGHADEGHGLWPTGGPARPVPASKGPGLRILPRQAPPAGPAGCSPPAWLLAVPAGEKGVRARGCCLQGRGCGRKGVACREGVACRKGGWDGPLHAWPLPGRLGSG